MASSPTSSRKESDIEMDNMKDKLVPHKQSDAFIPLKSDAVANMDDDLLTASKEARPVIIEDEEDNLLEITTVSNNQIADDTLMNDPTTSEGTSSYCNFKNFMKKLFIWYHNKILFQY